MMELTNPWALYAFAVLVPVIILYLLKPKPKDLRIPSLMFIMSMEQRRRFRSFFRRIIRDPLLLIQIIALSLLVLAIANPFYTTKETIKINREIVIVIDMSASMQAGTPTAFDQAIGTAQSIILDLSENDKVSVLLAENMPSIVLKQGTKYEAASITGKLVPKATPTGIGGAILLGANLLKDSKVDRIVYVLSDFSSYEGIDPRAAQKTAFAEGISVKFIRIGTVGENVGIVSSRSGKSQSGCFMEVLAKNYGQNEKMAVATLTLDGRDVSSAEKTIKGGSSEVFSLSSACSNAEHEAITSISVADDLRIDNSAYAIIPATIETDVLLIREKDSGRYVKYALESLPGVNVDESYPPIYPQDYSGYDVIVFQDSLPQNLLEGTFRQLRRFVGGGGDLIVFGFEGLLRVSPEEAEDILPIVPVEISNYETSPLKLFEHQILKDVDIEDIGVKRYLYADSREGSVTLAEVSGSPALSLMNFGSGQVVYVGIYPDTNWSDFQLKPSFPVFWNNLLTWLNRDKSLGDSMNFKTGESMLLGINQTVRVKRPSGEVVEGTNVMLDEVGFYTIEGSGLKATASLLDERESDTSYRIDAESMDISEGYTSQVAEEYSRREVFWFIAAAALVFIAIEWFYYRGRGSL